MANGTTCCAAEICCPPAQARKKVVEALAKYTGVDPLYCERVMDWMEHEGLIFAPKSLRPFVQDVVAMAKKHAGDQ